MKANQKQDTRKKIELGGLVKIAGLYDLNPATILALLDRAKDYYDRLSPAQRKSLTSDGIKRLSEYNRIKKRNHNHNRGQKDKWLI